MTDPTVYAYLDLAERTSGMRYVPTSAGTTMGLNEDQWRRVDRYGETMLCNCDTVFVRGARALEVAEREVDTNIAERVGSFGPKWRIWATASNVGPKNILVYASREGCTQLLGEFPSDLYPSLSRAVDFRDRLRARLAETGTKFATLTKSDARERVGLGIDCASTPKREEQPVFLATLRQTYAVTNGSLPWSIRGDGWTWYMTHMQANELKYTGKTEGTDKDGVLIEFVAQDWKPHIHVNADTSKAVAVLNDVKALAESLGREVTKALNQEVKPMPEKPKPAPDLHAECRLSLRDGVLVDDYGRVLCGAYSVEGEGSGDGDLCFKRVRCGVVLNPLPPDAATSPTHQDQDPLYIESERPLPASERERISAELHEKTGRPVVMLVAGLRRSVAPVEPEERQRLADISRRADLAAASKKGWRWGLAVGAVLALTLSAAALGAVAKLRPEWLTHLASRQHASADEHAQESEDACVRAQEGR